MISVIVPVYNVESYLRQCVDSILSQTYRDIEILLIDDGSPDQCGEICDAYAGADSRIRAFHTENKGLSAARNLGLREARGEYIGFVDSDDWIEPDMYEILLHRLEETGTNISACGVWKEFQNSREDNRNGDGVYFGIDAILAWIQNPACFAWNKLYKKACWEDVFFPETHTQEDVATLHKVILKADSFLCISKPLYHYRAREGSISHTPSMKNLMDCWAAHYGRYSFFYALPEVSKNHEIMDHLEELVALAAVAIWRWVYRIPKEQRDYVFLHKVSVFVQKHFLRFGKENWSLPLRMGIFFCRYPNAVSFAIMYASNSVYELFKRIAKKPFPFCCDPDLRRKK